MHKLNKFLLYLLFLIPLTSCDKDSPVDEEIPSEFVQQSVLEGFSGEWCPPCATSFDDFIAPVLDSYPDVVHYISYHLDDPFSTSESEVLSNLYEVLGVPNAMVDRYDFPTLGLLSNLFLSSKVEERTAQKTSLGISLNTESDDLSGEITASVYLNEPIDEALKLNIYLLENNVQSINQAGTSDPNFKHKHLFRQSITPFGGIDIEQDKTKESQTFSYIFDLSHFAVDQIEFVAFIETQSQILQSQHVKLGENSGWD